MLAGLLVLAPVDRCPAVQPTSKVVIVITTNRVTKKPKANSLIGLDSLSWSLPTTSLPPLSVEIFLLLNIRMGRVKNNLELDLVVYLSPKRKETTSILI